MDQGGGHQEELAGDVEVETLHGVDVGQVLIGNPGDLDIVDIHLVLLDEMEQKVEGAFEIFDLYFVRHARLPQRPKRNCMARSTMKIWGPERKATRA